MSPLPVLLLFAASLVAQSPSFHLLPYGSAAPEPRLDGTIALDDTSGRLYVFGGSGQRTLNDLWVYHLAEQRWQALSPTGAPPAPRFGHTLSFDARRGQLLLFGGQAGGFFSDVWAYDIAANSWQRLAADDSGPSRRYGHSAILDPTRDRLIISHGFTTSGRFDDTWAFDLNSRQWRNLTPSGTKPLRRCLHHAALDPKRNRMLLFGGCASGFGPCPLDDLWALDLERHTWAQLPASPRPSGRQHYGIGFDATRDQLIVFGGSGNGTTNDVWEWSSATQQWASVANLQLPSPRERHEGTSSATGSVYFFGGSTSNGLSNELWRYGTSPAITLTSAGIVSAFGRPTEWIAPGELITLYGQGLDGRALFDSQAAEVLYRSPTQWNVRVPESLPAGSTATLILESNGRQSAPIRLPVRSSHLSVYPAAVLAEGTINSARSPAAPGDVILLFGTGHGTGPLELRATLAGQPLEILYAGHAPGFPGLFQLNAKIPPIASAGAVLTLELDLAGDLGSIPLFVR